MKHHNVKHAQMGSKFLKCIPNQNK